MRKAVETFGDNLLPNSVLWRTKEAFSDGVSKKTKSWYEIIQDYVKKTTAPYKYPREIQFRESLPKTISGKIRRVELREET